MKSLLAEKEDDLQHQSFCQLPAQREMTRAWRESSPDLWVRSAQELPSEAMKFSLNASLNTLPTNANLQLWGKRSSDTCILCRSSRQTLEHILNNCPKALELHWYSIRHDAVLNIIGCFIKSYLPAQFSMTVDSPSEIYHFPHHITPTNL